MSGIGSHLSLQRVKSGGIEGIGVVDIFKPMWQLPAVFTNLAEGRTKKNSLQRCSSALEKAIILRRTVGIA